MNKKRFSCDSELQKVFFKYFRDLKLFAYCLVLSLFFISSGSAADPGHSAPSIGSGTFESGNYVFPANLNVTQRLNATYFCLAGNCISSWDSVNITSSGSAYNSTYHTWAYNQTTPAIAFVNTMVNNMNSSWLSSYNASYVPYSGASGAVNLNNQDLTNVNQMAVGKSTTQNGVGFYSTVIDSGYETTIGVVGISNNSYGQAAPMDSIGGYFIGDIESDSASDYIYGVKGSARSSFSGNMFLYGGFFDAIGTTGHTTYGLYASASGGTKNYAAIFNNGLVGINKTVPNYALDVNGLINSSGLCIGSKCIDDWSDVNMTIDSSSFVPYTGATTELNLNSQDLVNVQQLGIGTSSVVAGTGLQVTSGSLWINGSTGTTPTSGAGTRMMWIPAKSAFRAGTVSGAKWNDDSIGSYSFAAGHNTNASGSYSTALGFESTASGLGSIASGYGSLASGSYSTASGLYSTASGPVSTALGHSSFASGENSVAIGGYNSVASGLGSISIGGYTDDISAGNYYVSGPQVSGMGSIGIGSYFSLSANESFAVGFSSTPIIYANNSGVGIGTTSSIKGMTVNASAYSGDFVIIL